ncbi:hypothetical protein K457DRAFT_26416 [Linnemannia elongata AG-77]|uniref:Uncharacterized protein n=1 Tax=Linnemannia elongata AG-77 TaxID=1314771 RepID=A0A197JC49_9FUNG|nr:hypothetical protein K457DRAFT_26416 [Linnemannia elongata AG-77]
MWLVVVLRRLLSGAVSAGITGLTTVAEQPPQQPSQNNHHNNRRRTTTTTTVAEQPPQQPSRQKSFPQSNIGSGTMGPVDVFSILGDLGTFLIPIFLLFWATLQNTEEARDIWNWLGDAVYGKSWYGDYYGRLKGDHYCGRLRSVEQPVLSTKLEECEHFGHVSRKPASQTCWTILPELTCVGSDGIKFEGDQVRRDTRGRVMLKIKLDDLMQLLVRDLVWLNQAIPWDSGKWRQKTRYGWIELAKSDGIMVGVIELDPAPYNHTHPELSMKGDAVKQLWEKRYTGLPHEMFDGPIESDECAILLSKLCHLNTDDGWEARALSPSKISAMLIRFSQLLTTGPYVSRCWNEAAVDASVLAMRFQVQNERRENLSDLVALAGKLEEIASRDVCANQLCATKKDICLFYHKMIAGDFDVRFVPAWTYKRTWYGPNAVYFGGAVHPFFPPMSTSTNNTILQLQEQIALMGQQITRLQRATNVDQDPQVQGQVAATTVA